MQGLKRSFWKIVGKNGAKPVLYCYCKEIGQRLKASFFLIFLTPVKRGISYGG